MTTISHPRCRTVACRDGGRHPKASDKRIVILTGYSNDWLEIARLTVCTIKEYASRHDHQLMIIRSVDRSLDAYRHQGFSWQRIGVIMDIISGRLCNDHDYDWIWSLDADAMITNMTIPITGIIDKDYDYVVSKDRYGANCGSFLIRCSRAGLAIVSLMWELRHKYAITTWTDQAAFNEIQPACSGHITFVPQRIFNSYDYRLYGDVPPESDVWMGQWQPGDFVLHLPGLTNSVRISEFQKHTTDIVR